MKNYPFLILVLIASSCYDSGNHRKTFYERDVFDSTSVEVLSKYVDRDDFEAVDQYIRTHKNLDIDTGDRIFNCSLLDYAIFNGKYDAFRALLNHGANPNHTSSIGENPLYFAVRYRKRWTLSPDSRYVSELLDYGADPDTVTCTDDSSSFFCPVVDADCLDYLRVLIEKGGANPDVQYKGRSALSNAIIQGRMDMVYYLVCKCNADMNLTYDDSYLTEGDLTPRRIVPLVLLLQETDVESKRDSLLKQKVLDYYDKYQRNDSVELKEIIIPVSEEERMRAKKEFEEEEKGIRKKKKRVIYL